MIWFNNPDNVESTPAQLWEYRNELTKRFIIILGRLTAEVGSRFESSTTMPHYLFLMRDVIMRLKSLDFNCELTRRLVDVIGALSNKLSERRDIDITTDTVMRYYHLKMCTIIKGLRSIYPD